MLLEIFYLICTQKLCFKRYNPYTPRQNVGNPRYWPPCPRRNMSQYAKHWWSPNIVMWPLILKEILYWIIIKWLKTHILAVSTFLSHRQAHKWRGFFFTKFTTLNHSYNFQQAMIVMLFPIWRHWSCNTMMQFQFFELFLTAYFHIIYSQIQDREKPRMIYGKEKIIALSLIISSLIFYLTLSN